MVNSFLNGIGLFLLSFANDINFGNGLETVEPSAFFVGALIVLGIVFIILAFVVIFFLKKIIVNSILGMIVWAIAVFVFNINLPLVPSFVVSAVFGLAGIGAMLLLHVLGFLMF